MAYTKQSKRILTGGLNLLPPADLIPEQDSIAAQNWRVDQQGNLRSRFGHTVVDSLAGTVNSIYLRDNVARYYGSGFSLFQGVTALAAGFDGTPIDMVSYLGWLWAMNRAKQGKATGLTFYNWLPAAPTVAPTIASGGAGNLAGSYTWYVSFDTDVGHESNLSPVTVTAVITNELINFTNIPISPDPLVTKRRIYRAGGTQDALYRVATIADNTTTTYTDNLADDDAARLGITHSQDHDPPPPASGLVGPYFGKLLAFNSLAHPNRIWWTPTLRPWYWPGSAIDVGNWVDVGEDGEAVVAISIRPKMAVIYKERSIHRMVGDPDQLNGEIERTNADVGLIGRRAWAQAGAFDYIQTLEGVQIFDGDRAQKVNANLDPLFKGDFIPPSLGTTPRLGVAGAVARESACMAYKNGRLYYSYPNSASATPNATLVLDTQERRWYSDTRGFSALYYEGQTGDLLGSVLGNVAAVEDSFTDAGAAIQLLYQSAYMDQGAPDNDKTYADLVIEHDTAGATLTVTAYFDNGNFSQVLGTITSNGSRDVSTLPFTVDPDPQTQARNISIRIEGPASARVLIYSLHLHFYVEPRESRTWDSGPIRLGDGWKIVEVNAVGVELQSLDEVRGGFETDLPERELTKKKDIIVPDPGLSRKRVALMPVSGEGHIARVTLHSPRGFRLYSAGLWVRPVGLYLVPGQVFRTQKLDAGSKRIKWVKKVAVYCRTDAPIAAGDAPLQLGVTTDHPAPHGDTFGLSTGSEYQWVTVTLPGSTRARLFDLNLTARQNCRIRAMKVWLRVATESGGSAWEWYPVPVDPTPDLYTWLEIPVGE